MTKKRTKKEAFEIMLWAMISDCGREKKWREFQQALAKASDVLNGTTEFKPRWRKK